MPDLHRRTRTIANMLTGQKIESVLWSELPDGSMTVLIILEDGNAARIRATWIERYRSTLRRPDARA